MPVGATIFANAHGTAPGLALSENGKTAILLPGPPSEMKPMFDESVVPYLMGFSDKVLVSHNLRLFGTGESQVEEILYDLMKNSSNPTVAPYAKKGEVTLRVTAAGDTAEECEKLIAPVVAQIEDKLGQFIYGIDVANLQTAVVEALKEKHLSVATAESCTGGLISQRITQVAGASDVFGCGVCSYSNEIKQSILHVSGDTLMEFGAVSKQTAAEMAQGVRQISGADIGVSTTGVAGPGGGSEEKPVGLVYIAIDSEKVSKVIKLNLQRGRVDDREHIRHMSAQHVFQMILDALKSY